MKSVKITLLYVHIAYCVQLPGLLEISVGAVSPKSLKGLSNRINSILGLGGGGGHFILLFVQYYTRYGHTYQR